ncbi:MAG: PIN domain-containing protein [Defluviitaleaceae bacterium]|nr:PIN domain-containing protein [Defluviitaleaceae bacterium]MCL2239287.1 PIN domain-containing protein [Defluviitaleaceae bacterium]
MKILIDTNVILDSLASRKPHDKNADDIFDLIAKNHVEGYLNTSSVTDIYYILRKTLGDTASRNEIKKVLYVLQAIEITKSDCQTALDSPLPDFEDALLVVCAEKVKLDYIVTRDEALLVLPNAVSPTEFLSKIIM